LDERTDFVAGMEIYEEAGVGEEKIKSC